MKTSLAMWSFHREIGSGRMDTAKFIAEAKRLGYESVDLLAAWVSSADQVKQAKRLAADQGLNVCCYSVSNNFAMSGAELNAQVDMVRKGIEIGVELGAKIVRVFSANAREGLTFDQAFVTIVDGFKRVVPDARAAGVTLALENHGTLACTSERVKKIIREVGSPNLKSTFDIGNFLIADEDPLDAAKNLAGEVAHAHVKDHRWTGVTGEPPQVFVSIKGRKLLPEIVGDGQIDFVKVFKILKKAGFNGHLSLEYEGNDPEPEGVYTSTHNLFRLAAEVG
jgi:sugar phosphate isomerase/epimerase